MTNEKRDFIQSLWDFFCSLKLTMFLLIGLALVSIIGTIIPQGSPPPEYVQQISTAKLKLYTTLGFFDMYHSWWFIFLLYLLTVNLVACSIKRLPHIWKTINNPATIFNNSLEKSLSGVVEIRHSLQLDQAKDKAAAVLKSEFAEPLISEADGDWHLFAQKTPWCRLAVYFVHLSVIIIFIGAIIGSVFGYKGFVNIMEGETVSSVMSRSNKEIDLGFSLRCEQFSVTHYPSGAPKEFKSILTVLENGKPVQDFTNARVIVNDPLNYKGITFYQSSYGNAGNHFFTITDMDGKNPIPVTIQGQSSATLPDGSTIHVLEATNDVSKFAAGMSGPAAQVELHAPNGKSESFVVYASHPELNIQHAQQHGKGPVIHYKGSQQRMYTGLQVAKDPGVEIVWLGCILMIIGIYAAFFMSHRRIWVRIQNGSITVGGNASKNQSGFQLYFENLTDKLKAELSGEEKI